MSSYSHSKWLNTISDDILLVIREDLTNPPPSEEWFVKQWWKLRLDAVREELEHRKIT